MYVCNVHVMYITLHVLHYITHYITVHVLRYMSHFIKMKCDMKGCRQNLTLKDGNRQ